MPFFYFKRNSSSKKSHKNEILSNCGHFSRRISDEIEENHFQCARSIRARKK